MIVEEYMAAGNSESMQSALTLVAKCAELLDPSWIDIHISCYSLMYKCATDLNNTEKIVVSLANLIGEKSITHEKRLEYSSTFLNVTNQLENELLERN